MISNETCPVVDLRDLPIELQAVEYYDRLERGKVHPNAVRVTFKINNFARTVAESWQKKEFFFAS